MRGAEQRFGPLLGANDRGQLGVAAPTRSDVPIVVPGISNAVSVTAGYAHTCAVLNNGSVRCWGANDHGQLGNNSTDDASVSRPATGG